MNKKMTILYEVGKNLYINITNRCPCACVFCIRNNGEGAYGSDSLWLEREPSDDEIISELEKTDLSKYNEIVFCGFGEPLERLETVAKVGKHLKSISKTPVRLNTNGLSDLIHQRPTAKELEGAVDVVSVSLNAGSAEEYFKVTRPRFGIGSFDALIKFAEDCKRYIPKVVFTVVDVIPEEEIEKCREISRRTGIELRIRKYDS